MANIKMNRSTGRPQEGFPPHLDWDPYEEMMRDERKDPAAMRQKSPLDLAREYYAETGPEGEIPEDYNADPRNAARRYELESKAPTEAGRMHDSTTDRLRAIGAIESGDVEKTNMDELPEELMFRNRGRRR